MSSDSNYVYQNSRINIQKTNNKYILYDVHNTIVLPYFPLRTEEEMIYTFR